MMLWLLDLSTRFGTRDLQSQPASIETIEYGDRWLARPIVLMKCTALASIWNPAHSLRPTQKRYVTHGDM